MATYEHPDEETPRFTKDPDDILDYWIDWGANWLNDGDIISDSSWDVTPDKPSGLNIDSDSFTDTETVVYVSGGAERQEYRLTNTINTDDGLRRDQTLIIEIEER